MRQPLVALALRQQHQAGDAVEAGDQARRVVAGPDRLEGEAVEMRPGAGAIAAASAASAAASRSAARGTRAVLPARQRLE